MRRNKKKRGRGRWREGGRVKGQERRREEKDEGKKGRDVPGAEGGRERGRGTPVSFERNRRKSSKSDCLRATCRMNDRKLIPTNVHTTPTFRISGSDGARRRRGQSRDKTRRESSLARSRAELFYIRSLNYYPTINAPRAKERVIRCAREPRARGALTVKRRESKTFRVRIHI